MASFDIIVAYALPNYGVGLKNALPWNYLKQDMKRFRRLTTNTKDTAKKNAIIMGRNTWESLPRGALPGRLNCVISSSYESTDAVVFSDLDTALTNLCCTEVENVFVIGGGLLYAEAVKHPSVRYIYATEIYHSIEADVFFPRIVTTTLDSTEVFEDSTNKTKIAYRFLVLQPKKYVHPEHAYLNLLKKVMTFGETRDDRTGTGTVSLFGERIEFSLDRFPLLTTKRVFWRGIVEELLWFLRGSTDATQLQEKHVKIWDGNSSREFLDNRGLSDYRVGELGPVYGFQWRNFGATYKGCDADYSNKGVDQIKNIIQQIKNDPTSRRIICSAWNPVDLDKMALPPCHILFQFYVEGNNHLSCQLYQRSADLFLGLPFNIASYALLTHIVAQRTGLIPGKLSICIGDAHIYKNHMGACLTQLQRNPREFPTLEIKNLPLGIDEYTFEDFVVNGYQPHKTIAAPISA